jgi:hypothetical protein
MKCPLCKAKIEAKRPSWSTYSAGGYYAPSVNCECGFNIGVSTAQIDEIITAHLEQMIGRAQNNAVGLQTGAQQPQPEIVGDLPRWSGKWPELVTFLNGMVRKINELANNIGRVR